MARRRLPLKSGLGRLTRRHALGALATLLAAVPKAHAFGDSGAFHARVLLTGSAKFQGLRGSAPSHWAWELVQRTSAPGRLTVNKVSADDRRLLREPFVVWAGQGEIAPLTQPEVRRLEQFLRIGGVMVVDDADGPNGAFGRAARREIARVLPEAAVIRLDPSHVIYKTYYIIDRPVGRVLGPPHLHGIVRGKNTQVIFLEHDLLGALARSADGWAMDVTPGGAEQREYAVRLAVNLAMYVLCSDYKDDQVHAPYLMRRRASQR
jgi:hypothetical protein